MQNDPHCPCLTRQGRQIAVSVANNNVQLVQGNPTRLALTVSANGTTEIFLTTDPNGAVGTGILIPPDTAPFRMDHERYGDILARPLFVNSTGTFTVYAWETTHK